MKIHIWREGMSDKEALDGAYWERNVLALRYAQGWYFDLINNYLGWKRVLTLDDGQLTFHIPDDFEVGDLKEVQPNWDGHTTLQKWARVLNKKGIIAE